MGIQLATLFFILGFCIDSLTADEKLSKELIESIRNTRFNIFSEMLEINYQINELKLRSVNRLYISVMGRLEQKNFPNCNDTFVKMFFEDITKSIMIWNSLPCFKKLLHLFHQFGIMLDETSNLLTSAYHQKSNCIMKQKYCSSDAMTLESLNRIQITFSDNANWTEFWQPSTECFKDFLIETTKSILNLKLTRSVCDEITNYKDFMQKLSLYPLELNKLADPNEYWYPYSKLTDVDIVTPKSLLKNEFLNDEALLNSRLFNGVPMEELAWIHNRLLKNSKWLIVNINDYVQTLQMKMKLISDISLKNVRTLISETFQEEISTVPHRNENCFQNLVHRILYTLDARYTTQLDTQCFDVIPNVIQSFAETRKTLNTIITKLDQITNCYPINDCEQLIVKITNIETWFERWSNFDFSSTWAFARKCYNVGNSVVLGNIRKYAISRVTLCHMTPLFEGLFSRLPMNDQNYPEHNFLS